MSFFGKIKSAVMGNPVTREYEIGKQVASAGPGLMWKVHQATKKSTRQEMSVFLFNKQTPDFEKLHKKQREQILEMLRKGPNHLVRLRHPRLLIIDHPLEESNDCLAFATEPVTIGLANILGNYDNLPSPLPLSIKEYEVHPIEIQYGLYNLSEAMEFLHCGVRLMHGNITPEVVVVTPGGTWKLMGFNFSCYSQYQSETTTTFQFQEWDTKRPHNTNPSLDYLAPEYILTKSCSEKSDVFSFGMLCYSAYNGGRPLCSSLNNLLSFKQNVETISRVTESGLGEVPHGLRTLVKAMLAVEPSVRPDAMEISKHAFFDEVGVATLRYLDTLYEKGDMERSQYFKKNLALVITKLPKRVIHQRVIPALREEFRNNKMVPFVLPIILLVAEDCTMQEYSDVIMPVLIPALRIQDPIQVPLILLQKMDLLLKKTSPEDFRQHVLPTIISSLETTNTQLQELCISLIPSFATTVDYSSMKHSIIPRLTALMVSADSVSLQVKCLVAVGKMLDSLDKHIVHDHILPLLQQIPSREPGVLMAILGIYHAVMKNKKMGMDKVFLATRILPFLVPLSVEPTLNIAQFKQFMLVVRDMLQCVETEQQTHLEQLSKMEEQTRSTVEFAREVSEAKAMEDTINKFEETFGTGSHEGQVIQKRGSINQRSPPAVSGSTAATFSSQDGYDMLAGLFPEQPSMATTTTSPSPSPHLPKSTSSTPHPPPSSSSPSLSSTNKTTGAAASPSLKSLQQSQSSTSGMGMGVSGTGVLKTTSGMGMGVSGSGVLQPSQSNTSGMGMGVSSTGVSNTNTSGMGMGIMQPSQSNTISMGMGIMQPSQSNTSGMGMGLSGSGLLQPSKANTGGGGGGGMGMGTSGLGMGMSTGSGGMGMNTGGGGIGLWSGSSGTGPQNTVSQQPLNPQPINPQPTGSGGGSLFSGMQVHSSSGASRGLTGNASLTNQMTGQNHMTGGGDLIGGGAPLIPTETRSATGWSSDINKGKAAAKANPNTGWSSNIAQPAQSMDWMSQNPTPNQPILTPNQPNVAPSGNWMSQNPNQQMMTPMQPNVGPSGNWMSQNNPTPNQQMMAPMQPGVAPSGNWTMPMQNQQQQPFAQSGNWTAQNQGAPAVPMAASLMMGGPLLQPGNQGNQPPTQPQQPRQPNMSGNPFADLSFLE